MLQNCFKPQQADVHNDYQQRYKDPKTFKTITVTETATGNGDYTESTYDKVVHSLKISLTKNLKYLMVQEVLSKYPDSEIICVYDGGCHSDSDCDSDCSSSSSSSCHSKKSCHDDSSSSDSDCDKGCASACETNKGGDRYLTKTCQPTNLTGTTVGSTVLLVVGKKLSYCEYNSIICIGTLYNGTVNVIFFHTEIIV